MRRALLLAVLVLAPAFANAAAPIPQSWSPYSAPGHPLNALALADASNLTALVWAQPAGQPAVSERYDASALSTDDGLLWNAAPPGGTSPIPPGKDLVAVSRDGGVMVAGLTTSGDFVTFDTDAPLTPGQMNPATQQPSPATMSPAWRVNLAGTLQALALSADGRTTAAAEFQPAGTGPTAAPAVLRVRVYDSAGSERLAHTPPGNVRALAFPEDGARVFVASEATGADDAVVGSVQLVGITSSGTDTATLDSPVVALGASRDASVLVAGTSDGHAVVWRPRGASLGAPERDLDLGLGAVRNVAVARSGTTALVGTEDGFAVLRLDGDLPRVAYNVTLEDPVAAVDLSDDGSYFLVVAKDAYGYGASGRDRLWNLTGPFRDGEMDGSAQVLVLQRGDAVEAYRFGRELQFLHATAAGRVPDVPAATPGPDGNVVFDTVVVATGGANDRIRIRLPQAPGVEFSSNVTEASLQAGAAVHVRIVAKPAGLPPGAYAFVASAESLQGGGVANLTLPLSVQPRSGVALALTGPAERVLERGATDDAIFVIQNGGNTRINATLSFTQVPSAGSSWPVELQTTRTPVPAGASTSIVLRVAHPPNAANGTVDRITLTAVTDAGTVSKTVTYTLSPTLGIKVDTPSRVRFVGPAQVVWFNLTVQNTGSVRAPYEIFYEKLGETGAGWNVEVDVQPFNLTPAGTASASRVVPLKVFAPSTGTSTDRVTLFVEARSLAKVGRFPVAAQNLTLIANLDPNLAAKPPGEVPCDGARCLPATPAVGAVVAFAAVALVLGRRRR